MNKKLLLISNSTMAGEPYLDWCRDVILKFLNDSNIKNVLFFPFAGVNIDPKSIEISYNAYESKVQNVFHPFNIKINSIHHYNDYKEAINQSECIMVGGGNTFHLVYELYKNNLMTTIREKSLCGIPYIGWSAGANLACPTIKTTNDMPIVFPKSFDALNLIDFQINPHYIDHNPADHGGETREQRILEFLVVNKDMKVLGLREGTYLEIYNDNMWLKGDKPARLFQFNTEPREIKPGENMIII